MLPVLPRDHRLRESDAFRATTRSGVRAGSRTVVVHLADPGSARLDGNKTAPTPAPPRVGFVVSKAVGIAVVRNLVKRRLRHLMREHVGALPPGSTLVVRALPAAADASSPELRSDLARCLQRVQEASR